MNVLFSRAQGNRLLSMLYSRLLSRYTLCDRYTLTAQHHLGRPSWFDQYQPRHHPTWQQTSDHPRFWRLRAGKRGEVPYLREVYHGTESRGGYRWETSRHLVRTLMTKHHIQIILSHRLCITVPLAGNRIFEAGDERIFRLNRNKGKYPPPPNSIPISR